MLKLFSDFDYRKLRSVKNSGNEYHSCRLCKSLADDMDGVTIEILAASIFGENSLIGSVKSLIEELRYPPLTAVSVT